MLAFVTDERIWVLLDLEMDRDLERTSQDVPLSTAHIHVNGGFVADHPTHSAECALCQRILVPDNDDLEIISICEDCKFLLLEDLETPTRDSHWRRPHRGRRTRQNRPTIYGNEDRSIDGDSSARLLQHTSSRTTPSSSRRWQHLFSDSESESFDNVDSLHGESENNFRSSRYGIFHSESDAISFSANGGDSDASVDGHGVQDTEMFIEADEGSNFDSDTDIDPMHAGLHRWNSDDLEEEEDEEDGEWEEADIEEYTIGAVEAGARLRNMFISSPSEGNGPVSWRRQFHSPEFEGLIRHGTRQSRRAYNHGALAILEASELPQHIMNSEFGDYTTGFGDLLEALTRSDIGRRGAPPAAVSFVNNLPLVIINEEHLKHDGMNSQLMIKTMRRVRQNSGTGVEIHGIQQRGVSDDSSSDVSDEPPLEHGQRGRALLDVGPPLNSSGGEGSGRRWFLLAAAPLVSLFGIVFVMWWGNPQGRRANSHCNVSGRGLNPIQVSGSSQLNQRGNGRRRWWSFC
ncbi:hypothetical protein OIU76_009901 [Salix suchowensis]|nr:hypothetical protein OIU76_009901 [Salix suchowensis]